MGSLHGMPTGINCRGTGASTVHCGVDMAPTEHTIHIHRQAPAKVPVGMHCNGCGVCCLFEPCPLGILLSRGRNGACRALRWDDAMLQYRCGAIVASHQVLAQSLPHGTRWLATVLAPVLRRLGLRWIAAGYGCDSSLEVAPVRGSAQSESPAVPASTTMSSSDLRARARPPHHD